MVGAKIIPVLFQVINKFQTAVATFAMAGLTTLVCIQVFLRYVLKAPLFGIEELEQFFAIWVYFFGGTMASFQKSHIQCGILGVYFKNKQFLYVMDIVRDVVSVGIAIFLAYLLWPYIRYETSVWKTSSILLIPTVLGEYAIFIAIIIMGIFSVRDVVETVQIGPCETQLGDKELKEISVGQGSDL